MFPIATINLPILWGFHDALFLSRYEQVLHDHPTTLLRGKGERFNGDPRVIASALVLAVVDILYHSLITLLRLFVVLA